MCRILWFLFLILAISSCKKKDLVDQPPPPPPYTSIKLESSSFTLGNKQNNVLDTFVLNYNKPITINYILLISDVCLPDINRIVLNNGKTVKFYNLLCARLGKDYQFQISVRDNEGQTHIDTVKFSYYSRKLNIDGEIMHFNISKDNKVCWISTNSPNRLYCLGLEDTTYRVVYDLSFRPRKFVLNPHNQKFYILNYPFYNNDANKIYVVNPSNGMLEKTMTLPLDQFDNPSNRFQVYDIDFGFNGYGVLNTGTVEYGPTRWRIIDSRENDTVYAHPEWIAASNGGNSHFRVFESIQPNYNRTKIYMQMQNAYPRAGVLDCNTKNLIELIYADTYPNHYLSPSKSHDKLFVASYMFQSIYSNGTWGSYTQFDNRYSSFADFSYKPGEQDVIYYRNRDYDYEFQILDYSNSKILMKTNVAPDFSYINATTDGKYILATTGGSLFAFNTDLFYKFI